MDAANAGGIDPSMGNSNGLAAGLINSKSVEQRSLLVTKMSTQFLEVYLPIPGIQRIIADYLMPDKELMIFRKFNFNLVVKASPRQLRLRRLDEWWWRLHMHGWWYQENFSCGDHPTCSPFAIIFGHCRQTCFYCCEYDFNERFLAFERIRRIAHI
jgi:hypothetical protein